MCYKLHPRNSNMKDVGVCVKENRNQQQAHQPGYRNNTGINMDFSSKTKHIGSFNLIPSAHWASSDSMHARFTSSSRWELLLWTGSAGEQEHFLQCFQVLHCCPSIHRTGFKHTVQNMATIYMKELTCNSCKSTENWPLNEPVEASSTKT